MLKAIFFVLLSVVTAGSAAEEFKWNWNVPLKKDRVRQKSGEVVSPDAESVWIKVASRKTYIVFVDLSTRRKLGDNVTMSHLYELQTIQEVADKQFKSVGAQAEYNCKQEQTRTLSAAAYKGSMSQDLIPLNEIGDPGSVGNSANAKIVTKKSRINMTVNRISDPGTWKPVTPGSTEEILWKYACGK
ncbi:MAG: surface-adhesin E family protein [Gallionella sp.]